jgi:hypothetical protein
MNSLKNLFAVLWLSCLGCFGGSGIDPAAFAMAAIHSGGGSLDGSHSDGMAGRPMDSQDMGGIPSSGGVGGFGGEGGSPCTDECGAQDPNAPWAAEQLGCPRGCWQPCQGQQQTPQAALQGAQAGFQAGMAACFAGGGVCGGGIVNFPGGWQGFCVYAAAWASAQACVAVRAEACAPGIIAIINGNQCVIGNANPICVWAEAEACAWAEAYAFAFACAGGKWR